MGSLYSSPLRDRDWNCDLDDEVGKASCIKRKKKRLEFIIFL